MAVPAEDVVSATEHGQSTTAAEAHAYAGLLAQLVDNERGAIAFYFVLAGATFAAGVLTPIVSNFFVAKDSHWLTVAGGFVVSCASSLPIKTIFAKRNRVSAFTTLLGIVKSIPQDRPLDAFHQRALEDSQKFLEKLLGQ